MDREDQDYWKRGWIEENGEFLRLACGRALPVSDDFRAGVIVVHGFRSDPSSLWNMVHDLDQLGIRPIVFGYPTTVGIVSAAERLRNAVLRRNRARAPLRFVAHSLGGLVVRAFLDLIRDDPIEVKVVVTLGTPHDGLTVRQGGEGALMDVLRGIGETVAANRSTTVAEILKRDHRRLLDNLPPRPAPFPDCYFKSCSGGNPSLGNRVMEKIRLADAVLDWALPHGINDGLVPETSSDLRNVAAGGCNCVHFGFDDFPAAYPSFRDVNHFSITRNDTILDEIETALLA